MNQDELIELMYKNNLTKWSYRNLTGGVVAIHSGWKI
jgi:demethylmenaquinone methyltransferase/2-methoxy-6-polyprenyl-1,4-benzoquinol methylase